MTEQLKPCPFCVSEAYYCIVVANDSYYGYVPAIKIECNNAGCLISPKIIKVCSVAEPEFDEFMKTYSIAVAIWNNRMSSDTDD